jgi:hypothetical protein
LGIFDPQGNLIQLKALSPQYICVKEAKKISLILMNAL